jgi:drug/metabolite transporter (DMT)-like permease
VTGAGTTAAVSRSVQVLALVAAAVVGMQVGAATVASRFALPETDPVSLAFMRYAIGVLSLAPFILAGRWPAFRARDLVPMGVLGITQFAILILLLNYGLTLIPAGRAALVFSAFPLLTLLFAAALGHEPVTLRKAIGVLLTMTGIAIALGDQILGGTGTGYWGEALVFCAAACGAICSVLYRPYLRRYPALPVAGFAMLASVMFLAVAGTVSGGLTNPLALSARALAAIAFIGLSSGVAFFILLWAYARIAPTRVTMFQVLAPLTATALGIVFLGEIVTWNFLAGLAAVAAGIVIALSGVARQ